jgi:hypothetical protein
MQLTKILLHSCNAFQASNKSHHDRRLLIPRPHTHQSSKRPYSTYNGQRNKQQGGDPGATQRHASTKNASRRELDVKGILDLKGKWKKPRRKRRRRRRARDKRAKRER